MRAATTRGSSSPRRRPLRSPSSRRPRGPSVERKGGELSVELFPGCTIDPAGDAPRPLVEADERDAVWLLDFHFPFGLTPLGITTFAPTYAATTRAAARALHVPGSDGFALRLVGPHVYVTARVPPAAERARRGAVFPDVLGAALDGFASRWAAAAQSLDDEFRELMAAPLDAPDLLDRAVAHERRAWLIHFEEMYALVAGHVRFRARCEALGVPAALADACLAGFRTRTSDADLAVLELAAALRDGAAPEGASLTALVERYGDRAMHVADPSVPSWREQPEHIVARVAVLARGHVDASGLARSRDDQRGRARREALERATDPDAFAGELVRAERANWIWWNEEHNALIDLRASLPLRRAARAIGARLLDDPDDAFLCSVDELRALAPPPPSVIEERRAWLAAWRDRRDTLPAARGDGEVPDDPLVAEIFGVGDGGGPHGRTLSGTPASAGVAEGRVRVVHVPDALVELRPGDVLVCEATSPSWAYGFAVAGAAVCDGGGYTTHAAIAAREYGIPCVVGTRGATRWLRDGQRVLVDGDGGTVTLLD